MQYHVEVLSRSLQGAAASFLLLFAVLSLVVSSYNRRQRLALQERMHQERLRNNLEPLPHALAAEVGRSSPVPSFYLALWCSLAGALVVFLTLAYSPFSTFPNFRTPFPTGRPDVELTELKTDFQGALMKIDGEVTNIGESVLPELHVHLILYDQDLRPAAVRTIDIKQPLAVGQIMPFFFSEERSNKIRRVGVTFSSRFRPLRHTEAPGVSTSETGGFRPSRKAATRSIAVPLKGEAGS